MTVRRVSASRQHLCGHPRCSIVIDKRFLMCLPHWQAVPVSLRREVLQAFSAWRTDPGNGTKLLALQRKQAEAIRMVS
jgi:hypothetical protein